MRNSGLGRAAYEGWAQRLGWKTNDGTNDGTAVLEAWDALPAPIQAAWEAAADQVAGELMEHPPQRAARMTPAAEAAIDGPAG